MAATIGGLTSSPGTPPGNLISGNGIAGLLILNGNDRQGQHHWCRHYRHAPVGKCGGHQHFSRSRALRSAARRRAHAISSRLMVTLCDANDAGVIVSGSVATGNAILGNSIFSNGGLGIDLTVPFDGPCGITANDNCDTVLGPNNLQNYPILTSALSGGGRTAIQGSLNSVPNRTFRIEFFDNHQCHPSGNGSGETFIGSTDVTTDDNCTAPFSVTFGLNVQSGHVITATATDPGGNTSEFSRLCAGDPWDAKSHSNGHAKSHSDGNAKCDSHGHAKSHSDRHTK